MKWDYLPSHLKNRVVSSIGTGDVEFRDDDSDLKAISEKSKSKYNNQVTVVDGIVFDSAKEADYYAQLKLRLIAQGSDRILGFTRQVAFVLQDAFVASDGSKIRAIKYYADFLVTHVDHLVEVVDVKGVRTKEYQIKRKMFLFRYPQYIFTEI